jgi:hypothetical protein
VQRHTHHKKVEEAKLFLERHGGVERHLTLHRFHIQFVVEWLQQPPHKLANLRRRARSKEPKDQTATGLGVTVSFALAVARHHLPNQHRNEDAKETWAVLWLDHTSVHLEVELEQVRLEVASFAYNLREFAFVRLQILAAIPEVRSERGRKLSVACGGEGGCL